jgi:coiled-coil domain-containing protein 63/114
MLFRSRLEFTFSFFLYFCLRFLFSCRQLHKETALIRDNEITESLYKETICDGRKNVVKLENRLDVITKRCGCVMAENAKLREIIDHMLQER